MLCARLKQHCRLPANSIHLSYLHDMFVLFSIDLFVITDLVFINGFLK